MRKVFSIISNWLQVNMSYLLLVIMIMGFSLFFSSAILEVGKRMLQKSENDFKSKVESLFHGHDTITCKLDPSLKHFMLERSSHNLSSDSIENGKFRIAGIRFEYNDSVDNYMVFVKKGDGYVEMDSLSIDQEKELSKNIQEVIHKNYYLKDYSYDSLDNVLSSINSMYHYWVIEEPEHSIDEITFIFVPQNNSIYRVFPGIIKKNKSFYLSVNNKRVTVLIIVLNVVAFLLALIISVIIYVHFKRKGKDCITEEERSDTADNMERREKRTRTVRINNGQSKKRKRKKS